ncbi:MAG: hypothetical protein C0394_10255 [Syntrophus sp. (in: bacteria)]|nr:hypothetical protein [Syntrophus sp. (in: bacteria)]
MQLPSLFNPAGGLRYHLRALRYSKDIWQPFRRDIGDYLLSWPVASKTLLIVGPSGGYCLPPYIFNRFDQLVCLEPDPLARYIFRRRLLQAPLEHRPRLEFITEDCLLKNPRQLVRLVEGMEDTTLLFSNVLGQLRFLLQIEAESDLRLMHIRDAVAEATQHRAFASFHDRVSGMVRPTFTMPFLSDSRLSDEALLSHLFAGSREYYRRINLNCSIT